MVVVAVVAVVVMAMPTTKVLTVNNPPDVYGLSYEDVVSLLEEEKAKREAELAESHSVSTSSVHGGPSTSSAPEEGDIPPFL